MNSQIRLAQIILGAAGFALLSILGVSSYASGSTMGGASTCLEGYLWAHTPDPSPYYEIFVNDFVRCWNETATSDSVKLMSWYVDGDVGFPDSCSGSVNQCNSGYINGGCDTAAYAVVQFFDESWNPITDYTIDSSEVIYSSGTCYDS